MPCLSLAQHGAPMKELSKVSPPVSRDFNKALHTMPNCKLLTCTRAFSPKYNLLRRENVGKWREPAAREHPPSRALSEDKRTDRRKGTKILLGPGSLRGLQLNFPIALAEAIPLNVWKLGLALVSRQYRTKSSAPTSINPSYSPNRRALLVLFAP